MGKITGLVFRNAEVVAPIAPAPEGNAEGAEKHDRAGQRTGRGTSAKADGKQ